MSAEAAVGECEDPGERTRESSSVQLLETPHVLVRTVAVGGFTKTSIGEVEDKARAVGEVRIGCWWDTQQPRCQTT